MTLEEASRPIGKRAPELLAPAGNWECVKAAIENGANAVYFGLQVGFNARARAANFAMEDLPQLMAMLHRRGLLGYVTLNTLVFTDELRSLEENVRVLAACGVDAVLVQDLGAARLIRRISPDLPIHASTQMTMTCAESIAVAQELGLERVVLARELALTEIRKIAQATEMPIEVFVHGALCVAYSGQCLTSESLGGRSANRGQCAQACRLNYELLCDDQPVDLGAMQYLLSPQDLAAYELIPQLIDAGVCSLKIEGRLKTPEYVANVVRHYRHAIDSAMAGIDVAWSADDKRELELSFSRGFSPGWLEGNNHKRLVPGDSSSKRGVLLGTVKSLRGERLIAELQGRVACGDGIVLDGDRVTQQEIGGRIFQIFVNGQSVPSANNGTVELGLQHGLLRDAELHPGQRIWLTDDPKLSKRLRESFEGPDPRHKLAVDLDIRIEVGEPIVVKATCFDGRSITVLNEHLPAPAEKHPIDETLLRKQFSRLGGTPYELRHLQLQSSGQPMVPMSILGAIRKQLVESLDQVRTTVANRRIAEEPVADVMLAQVSTSHRTSSNESANRPSDKQPSSALDNATQLFVLCRSLNQVRQVLANAGKHIYADFHDIREYSEAVAECRKHQAEIHLATLRIHKPGERGLFLALAKQKADGWLVRNLAAADFAHQHQIPAIADFSLNVTNPLTAEWLLERGMSRFTASYDLNRDQLLELVAATPASWLEVVIHQHMPMFHMEHCVFCSVVSPGTNKSNCGRPCDRHDVRLKDRLQVEHVLHADIGCRNTLYNGVPQSGAETVPALQQAGVRFFRIELLRDCPTHEVARLLQLYRELLQGKLAGHQVWSELKAHNRVGVTRGTLEHPRNPLAIL